MESYYETWDNVDYLVRVIELPEAYAYGSSVNVASRELWNAIEYSVYDNDKNAVAIDDKICFYVDDYYLDNLSDESLVSYIIETFFPTN